MGEAGEDEAPDPDPSRSEPPPRQIFEDDPAAMLAADLEAEAIPDRRRLADFSPHEWGVLLPLSLVGFFINYDTGLLTLAAPPIASGLGVSVETFGIGVAVIRLAALGSVFTLRLADKAGRRTMLLVSVLGFTIFTGLTALAWGLIAFVAFQVFARLFLATEETLAGVVLTEEMRPDRRGAGIGLLGIIATSGFGLVALMLLFVDDTPLQWRVFYVVALIPLVVVAYLRRNLRETTAFGQASEGGRIQTRWIPHVDRAHRPRLWRMSIVMALIGMLDTTAFFYASELAQNTYDWDDLFTIVVIAAAPTTLIGYLIGGRLSDRIGRKPALVGSLLTFSVGTFVVFSERPWLFALGFFVLTGGNAALQAVRAAYLGELFPTEVRATLSAFVSAVVVAGGSAGLILVGVLADIVDPSVVLMAVGLLVAASTLLVRRLPETAGTDVGFAA